MTYFKINDIDFSKYVNKLDVQTNHIATIRENANKVLQVDYLNSRKVITVGIIPLTAEALLALENELEKFYVQLTFLNPKTNNLETIGAHIGTHAISYYTIRADKILTKAFNLIFEESELINSYINN